MSQNLISATFSAEDAANVPHNLMATKARLSFLLSLQTEDAVTLLKVGNAYLPFIDKVYQVMVAHPEIIPPVYDQDEFIWDYNLLSTIRPIFSQISELNESIQKTFNAIGSDVLVGALEVYSGVKLKKDKVPGLSIKADEMTVFFKKSEAKVSK